MSSQLSVLNSQPPRQLAKKSKLTSKTSQPSNITLKSSRVCSNCRVKPKSAKGGCLIRVHHLSPSAAWPGAGAKRNDVASHTKVPKENVLRVCQECVIGYTLPVYRPQCQRFEMGTIHQYDQNSMRHQFEFADESCDWIHVDEDPFGEYAQYTVDIQQRHLGYRAGWFDGGKTYSYDPGFYHHNSGINNEYDSNDMMGASNHPYHTTTTLSPFRVANVHAMNPLASTTTVTKDSPSFNSPLPTFDPSVDGPSFDQDDNNSFDLSQFSFGLKNSWSFDDPKLTASSGSGEVHRGGKQWTAVGIKTSSKSPTRTIVTNHLSPATSMINVNEEKKKGPRFWTEVEDKLLLDAIAKSPNPIEWPSIALKVPGRNQKQCRERYLNHLNPNIRTGDWSPKEDAVIIMLEKSEGKTWRLFTKIPTLDGRTDNSIKNRFNHLNRRFIRVMKDIEITPGMKQMMDIVKNNPLFKLSEELASARTDRIVLKYVAKRIEEPENKKIKELRDSDISFGPFRILQNDTAVCERCSLIIPSWQTGDSMCTVSGWCKSCTETSVLVLRDVLRINHSYNNGEDNQDFRDDMSVTLSHGDEICV